MNDVVILIKDSYRAMIKNAIGAHTFRNLYALVNGEKQDILKDGDRSCAAFVSAILHYFKLIESPHATVAGLECDLQQSGWARTTIPKSGDVLVWEAMAQGEETHTHVGFFIGDTWAVSNDWQTGVPIQHHLTYGTTPKGAPIRAITTIYTHDFLA